MSFRRARTGASRWRLVKESINTTESKVHQAENPHRRKTRTITTRDEWLEVELVCGHWVREESKREDMPICRFCQYTEDETCAKTK
jgi:hypothetical protein